MFVDDAERRHVAADVHADDVLRWAGEVEDQRRARVGEVEGDGRVPVHRLGRAVGNLEPELIAHVADPSRARFRQCQRNARIGIGRTKRCLRHAHGQYRADRDHHSQHRIPL